MILDAGAGGNKLRITLRNAVILGSRQYMPDTQANEAVSARVPMLEEVSLSYSAIEWCWYSGDAATPSCRSFDMPGAADAAS